MAARSGGGAAAVLAVGVDLVEVEHRDDVRVLQQRRDAGFVDEQSLELGSPENNSRMNLSATGLTKPSRPSAWAA
jgi:hypothetical protein